MNPAPDVATLQGAMRLADWGVLHASGSDAASFLQGQLTQDVSALDEHTARLAGYCSPKGRLLASGVLWLSGADDFWLACSADLLPGTQKRLSMFVMRARCRLVDASAEVTLHGLVGAAATRWLGDAAPGVVWQRSAGAFGEAIRLPDAQGLARYLLAAPAGAAAPDLPPLAPQAWAWLEVSSGVARVLAATAEQFVPQMINFEFVGGVDFRKGCYPGQEVVARSQYRGTIKRRAFVFDSEAAAAPGQELFHSSDAEQPAGMVVNAATWAGSHRVLAEVKHALCGSGSLHLAAPGGPLLCAAVQPYELPLEATA